MQVYIQRSPAIVLPSLKPPRPKRAKLPDGDVTAEKASAEDGEIARNAERPARLSKQATIRRGRSRKWHFARNQNGCHRIGEKLRDRKCFCLILEALGLLRARRPGSCRTEGLGRGRYAQAHQRAGGPDWLHKIGDNHRTSSSPGRPSRDCAAPPEPWKGRVLSYAPVRGHTAAPSAFRKAPVKSQRALSGTRRPTQLVLLSSAPPLIQA
jgi:hypothetical protein